MKCHRNASPYSACFASRSCARFSPTTSMPASASTAMSATETYFVAATTVTRSQTSSRTRAYRARTSSGEIADHPLTTGDAAVAPVREEPVGVTRGAKVDALDVVDARGAKRELRRTPEVEIASTRDVAAEALPICVPDVVADLVTAWADAGTDCRANAPAPDRRDSRIDDSLQQPEPPSMQQREPRRPVGPGERNRQAVGRQLQHRNALVVRPEPVARRAAAPGLGAMHDGTVHLPVHRELFHVRADRGARTSPVLLHVRVVVRGHEPEVQRGVRPLADAAVPRRERDDVRGRYIPRDHSAINSRAAASSSARLVSSPFSLRRRSSSRTSPTRGDSPSPSAARSSPSSSSRTSRSRSKYGSSAGRSATGSV